MNTKFFSKENMKRIFDGNGAQKLYSSLICVAIGLFIGFIIMLIMKPQYAGTDFLMLITGGLKYYGSQGVGIILANFAPLLCCGVAIIFAYKTGIFNIGAAGQYIMGMFGALIFALYFKTHWTVCILMAIIFGALWGLIPGLLKAHFHVNEVISGIMLNWIALFLVNYLFQTCLISIVDTGNNFQTLIIANVNPSGALPNMGVTGLSSVFSIAFIIALVVAALAFIIMEKTTFGYQLKAGGYNRHAVKYAGINARRNLLLTMAISGAIAGLGASLYYLAGVESWSANMSNVLPQIPWNGIIIAFIAQLNPIGAVFAAAFLALLLCGSTATSQHFFPKEIADLITGVIVYLSGLTAITMRIIPWVKKKIHEKKHGKPIEQTLSVEAKKEGK